MQSEVDETTRVRLRDAAREQYVVGSSDDIEVDDNAQVSIGEHGAWVQAWLFVRTPEDS